MNLAQIKRLVSLIIITIVSFQGINAQKQNLSETFASEIYYQISGKKQAPNNVVLIENNESNNKYYVYNFITGGWVFIKEKEGKHYLFSFSEKDNYVIENNPFLVNFNVTEVAINEKEQKQIISESNYQEPSSKDTESTVEPFLTSVWGGVNCYTSNGSNVYPTNHYTPYNCSPGCVAISNAEVMNYYEWPITGVGSNVYIDEYEYTSENIRHIAFFDNTHYDWGNMLDEYMYVDSTVEEQEAVGTLMYHLGIAVEMNYELEGSTSNLNKTPFVVENFFRYSKNYHTSSWGSFWSRLYDNIQQQRPVPIAIENSANSEGHVMVANGYKIISGESHYFINWGWYNVPPTINAWYNIEDWEVGDPGYDTILAANFDMLPEPQITAVEATGNGDDFKVTWKVSSKLQWDEFTLEQKVDSGNWEEVASGITDKYYTITNPSGNVYKLRVKAKVNGIYYDNSWSEREVYVVENWYNGYINFNNTKVFAKQTPNNALNFTGDYTFETWIRLKDGNQNGDIIMDQKDVFGFEVEEVTSSNYSVVFKSHSSGSTLNSSASGSKIQNNQWAHIAVSKTGNTAKLFVNGELRDTKSSGFNLPAKNWYLNFGEKYHGSYSGFINADIDQLRISSTGRYASNFTPTQADHFNTDANTIAYLTFQDIHRYRLKDEAHNLSVIIDNGNIVAWNFEEITGSLSVKDQKLLNQVLQVFPNPTTDFITIDFIKNDTFSIDELTINLYDINGKNVSNIDLSKSNKINLSHLEKGIYILSVETNNFKATKKIIKQ